MALSSSAGGWATGQKVSESSQLIYVVIVEGVLLFCDADICQMFGACIWLETDMHRCAFRRNTRRKKKNQDDQLTYLEWYEHKMWVHYQQYKTMQLANVPNAFRIDASSDLWTIHAKAAAIIDRMRNVNQAEAAESDDERWTEQCDGSQRKQNRPRLF